MQAMPVKHRMKQNQKTKKSAHCIKRPKVLMVVEKVTRTTIKTIKDKNVTAVVKDELEKRYF